MQVKRITGFNTLFAAVLIAFVADSSCADTAKTIPLACQTDCATPYGQVVGVSGNVEAYSNCQAGCVNPEPNRLNDAYTGIKWQCVEYARRWLLVHKGAVYGDVDTAADIWTGIDHLTDVATNSTLPLESHLNGSTQAPGIGDLLIYARAFNHTGHVAIVTDVDLASGIIEVAEQNYSNEPWPGDYARKIELIRKGSNYWLLDSYLLGWKHPVDREVRGP